MLFSPEILCFMPADSIMVLDFECDTCVLILPVVILNMFQSSHFYNTKLGIQFHFIHLKCHSVPNETG